MNASRRALLSTACHQELLNISEWWLEYAQDEKNGGYFGEIAADNTPNIYADKGLILNARILWFFSEAARFTKNRQYEICAERAYRYLLDYFLDKKHGGFYWSVDYLGIVANSKKQVYGQAFALYGLAAYYALTKEAAVLREAMACFNVIETYCIDSEQGGYFEAYTDEWKKIEDVRLSEKDLNSPKTMNTHLHLVEAYTALLNVNPEPRVDSALRYGIECFKAHIIHDDTGHLKMFMGADWHDHSTALSYGHDIECSWLLWKAGKALGDQSLQNQLKPLVIKMADACQHDGIGSLGEAIDAYDWVKDYTHTQRLWWVQAEALLGYLNAYVITHKDTYLHTAEKIWNFIVKYQLDENKGEWLWHSSLDAVDVARDYKVGFWKGPYHNGRAMMEAIKLLRAY